MRSHPLFPVVVGLAAAAYGAARLIAARLDGATPWTLSSVTASLLLVLGLAVAGIGFVRWRGR